MAVAVIYGSISACYPLATCPALLISKHMCGFQGDLGPPGTMGKSGPAGLQGFRGSRGTPGAMVKDNSLSHFLLTCAIRVQVNLSVSFLKIELKLMVNNVIGHVMVKAVCCHVFPGSCWSEGRRGSAGCRRTHSKSGFVKLLSTVFPVQCSASMLYRMLGHMRQEAVSMVTSDRDHCIK